MTALDSGQISLRMYPARRPPTESVSEMRRQAQLAESAGWDGLMTSEHHGGFPDYVPNPIPLAGWLLDATESIWAAPCPLLLPLYHWTHVAEQLAWMAARFPDRVGAGVAVGGLALDFEMAELDYAQRQERFRQALPLLAGALRGEAAGPIASDPAIAACASSPLPLVAAAQGPQAVRRAAEAGAGVLYDSMQTIDRMRELTDAYLEAGGTGPRIAIRRAWVGPPPASAVESQMEFYRSYASSGAQAHWGDGQELIAGETGTEVAEKLAAVAEAGGCDAFNLRVHIKGIETAAVDAQITQLGEEALPALRREMA